MIKEITSKKNQFYKELKELKDRGGKEKGLVIIEGFDLIEMAVENGSLEYIVTLIPLDKYEDYDQYILTKELYRELSSYKSLPPAIGVARIAMTTNFGERVIYLDGIQDPGNLGTIIRTALAFGYSSVALSSDCVSPYNSKAVQATKGAIFSLPIGYASLDEFEDYEIYLTVLDGEKFSQELKPTTKFVLVLGNEGQGIRPEYLTLPSKKVKLEIENIDSLNVAVAGGIFMYLFKE